MKKLTNKVIIVTGASKGIGAAIAKGLAAAGASVVVNYATSRTAAENVVEQIKQNGGQAIAIQANVGLAADVRRLFSEALQTFGQVDALVNNAGYYQFQPVEEVNESIFYDHFDTNILGVVLTTQEAIKAFPESGGSIINMGTIAIGNPGAMQGIYAASKAAVGAFSVAMSKELGKKNIRVNMVSPGLTETEGIQGLGFVLGTDYEQQMIASTPLGRLGQPEDFVSIMTFLVSDESGWVTGATINVTGGFTG